MPAIEEAIFAGVPINVTLLFSREQYVAAAEAYRRGIVRRIAAGLNPDVASVASMFISRWDVAVKDDVPERLHNQLGIAVAGQTYEKYRSMVDSPPWQEISTAGARRQRLLWASTGSKDPEASDILYVRALAAPFTINTTPKATLNAFADHGEVDEVLSIHARMSDEVLGKFTKSGIDIDSLATRIRWNWMVPWSNSPMWNQRSRDTKACLGSPSLVFRTRLKRKSSNVRRFRIKKVFSEVAAQN